MHLYMTFIGSLTGKRHGKRTSGDSLRGLHIGKAPASASRTLRLPWVTASSRTFNQGITRLHGRRLEACPARSSFRMASNHLSVPPLPSLKGASCPSRSRRTPADQSQAHHPSPAHPNISEGYQSSTMTFPGGGGGGNCPYCQASAAPSFGQMVRPADSNARGPLVFPGIPQPDTSDLSRTPISQQESADEPSLSDCGKHCRVEESHLIWVQVCGTWRSSDDL